MKAILSTLLIMLALALWVDAGGGGKSAWAPFLSDAAYQELAARSIKAIEELAKSDEKNAKDKIEVEAAILAGYTLSVKNPAGDGAAQMRGAALEAVKAARKGDLKKLTEFGKSLASAPKAPAETKGFTPYLRATEPMMKMFLSKAKGGEGIHEALQYQAKLKNLNGIEALISTLAGKKVSDDNLAKLDKELPNLAYRLAVVGAITNEFTPKKEVAKWHELARDMRDSSIALAESAHQKNAEGIKKAAEALENTCIECHSVFK